MAQPVSPGASELLGKTMTSTWCRVKGYFSGITGSRTLKNGEVSGDWSLEKVRKKEWEIHL